jgi:hypothetical protein
MHLSAFLKYHGGRIHRLFKIVSEVVSEANESQKRLIWAIPKHPPTDTLGLMFLERCS